MAVCIIALILASYLKLRTWIVRQYADKGTVNDIKWFFMNYLCIYTLSLNFLNDGKDIDDQCV